MLFPAQYRYALYICNIRERSARIGSILSIELRPGFLTFVNANRKETNCYTLIPLYFRRATADDIIYKYLFGTIFKCIYYVIAAETHRCTYDIATTRLNPYILYTIENILCYIFYTICSVKEILV